MEIFVSILLLGIIGIIAAILLFVAAKRFHVHENPKIAEIEELLPGANCGGCGLSGCHAFAEACTTADSLDNLNCTGIDADGMSKIADILSLKAVSAIKRTMVIRCAADCNVRANRSAWDGERSCAIENSCFSGDSDCVYGCLGCGDCVRACPFGALSFSEETIVPSVNHEICTACGKCVKACPRNLCVLVPYHEDRPLVWVACANRDRGAVAIKECDVACIGCSKCVKVCNNDAVSVSDSLAVISQDKCTGCGECVSNCPRKSIVKL